MPSRAADGYGLSELWTVKRCCRRFRGGAAAVPVELFDDLYISRRTRNNDRFRIYNFIRG